MLFSAYCTGEFVDINNVQECIIFIVFLDAILTTINSSQDTQNYN